MDKYQNEVTERLSNMALDGFCEEEFGSVTEEGFWYGLLLDTGVPEALFAILREDNEGFVYSDVYASEQEALSTWQVLYQEWENTFHPEACYV